MNSVYCPGMAWHKMSPPHSNTASRHSPRPGCISSLRLEKKRWNTWGSVRSLLVTSHFADPLLHSQVIRMPIRILPKQLASEIPITVAEELISSEFKDTIDIIIVDDDQHFSETLSRFIFRDYKTQLYHDPSRFLSEVSKYPKNVKIYLDYYFKTNSLNGLEVAKQLHAQGYIHLYLLSGEDFSSYEIPQYLTVIKKNNIDKNSLLVWKN